MTRWVPHPWLSLVVGIAWLLVNDSIDPGHLILAVFFGVTIPRWTQRFWPDAPSIRRPGRILRLFVVFAYDIVVANFVVAKLVLGPNDRLRPAFLEIGLDLDDPFAIAVLASMITLTPGTLSAQVREGDGMLIVHALDTDDPEAEIATIKRRYERPLKEIFEC
ncbi:MAG: Na+/H+ antiporter subunit E [Myxococcota bacterium]